MIAPGPGAATRTRRKARPAQWRQAAWWGARWQSMRNYLGLLGWLLREGTRQAHWPLIRIVVAGYVGVVTGTAAFGCVALAARLLQSAHPVKVPGLPLTVPAEPWIIWTATLSSLVLAAACGLAIYYSTCVTRQLVRRLHVRLRRLAFDAAAHPGLDDGATESPPSSKLVQAANSDAVSISTSFGVLLGTLLPIITLLWTAAMLLYINATATVALVLLSGLYLGPMLWINRRAAQLGHAHEEARKEVNQALSSTLRYFKETQGTRRLDEQVRSQALAHRRFQQVLTCYDEHWLGKIKMRVWNTFFGSLCFLLVIVLHSQRTGSTGSGSLLAYLIALRFAWGSIGQVTRGLVSVSRFLPRLRRYDALLKLSQDRPMGPVAPLPAELLVGSDGPALPGSQGQAVLRRGEPTMLLAPLPLSRYTLGRLQRLLGAELPSTLIGNVGRFRTAKLLGDGCQERCTPWQVDFLQALAADWGVPASLLLEATESSGSAKKREREFAFWASQCLHEGPQLVWLDLSSFAALEPAFQKAFLARLNESMILLVGSDPDKALVQPAHAEATFLVADAEAVRGIGTTDWLRTNLEVVREMVRRRSADGSDGSHEEEEEEEIVDDL